MTGTRLRSRNWGDDRQRAGVRAELHSDMVTDGPFVESKEVLGGVTVIDARDLDRALEIARLSPATWRGGVEVRPILG